jgi:hypothetical protein
MGHDSRGPRSFNYGNIWHAFCGQFQIFGYPYPSAEWLCPCLDEFLPPSLLLECQIMLKDDEIITDPIIGMTEREQFVYTKLLDCVRANDPRGGTK